jgi:hypothetical protein
VDARSALHTESRLLEHVVAPGVHPQRSTGQFGGTTVQIFVSPPDAAYSPFTSQNGYVEFVQSESLLHSFTRLVHAAATTTTTSRNREAFMRPLIDRPRSGFLAKCAVTQVPAIASCSVTAT